MRKWTFGEEKT
jgi:hypothetical protein